MISLLKSHGVADWTAQDVHDNTLLHYLATHRPSSLETLAQALANEDLGGTWAERNIRGHTPAELLTIGLEATRELASTGEAPERGRYMPHWTDAMERLLRGKWVSSYPEDR